MPFLWEKIARPLLFRLDAEKAHELGMFALRNGLAAPLFGSVKAPELESMRFGIKFRNPLGLAAGFDKNARAVDQLAGLGFGFIEVGTVTLEPQPGNERPRLFRLPADRALINRLGFNNDGVETVAERLAKIDRQCVVGVNIGKNRSVELSRAVANYVDCFDVAHPVADYIAVNISSPNTPDLRKLQDSENLDELLASLQGRNRELGAKPLLVKIAPDLSEPELEAIVERCLQHGIDGVIATNTTIERSGLRTKDAASLGPGGLSGAPLRKRSTDIISRVYRLSEGRLPIIGVGGIMTPQNAFEKVAAGASLIQAYTGFVYGGPTFPVDIVAGLTEILAERGFASLDEAIGSAISGNV